MQTFNTIMCSLALVICLINLAFQEGKRTAYLIASLGWFIALLNIAF